MADKSEPIDRDAARDWWQHEILAGKSTYRDPQSCYEEGHNGGRLKERKRICAALRQHGVASGKHFARAIESGKL